MWNKNDPANNTWRTRDVTEMSAALNTAPIFIDEVKSNCNDYLRVLFCDVQIIFYDSEYSDRSIKLN